jgi:hypothetical protein
MTPYKTNRPKLRSGRVALAATAMLVLSACLFSGPRVVGQGERVDWIEGVLWCDANNIPTDVGGAREDCHEIS